MNIILTQKITQNLFQSRFYWISHKLIRFPVQFETRLLNLRTIIIVGGGLAGLITGIELAKAGVQCSLFEKKSYPFHRVCGEYISNEALPFLQQAKLFPDEFSPPQINRFRLSSASGKQATINLDLGGFGISRYSFDNFLYEKARKLGVDFHLGNEVLSIEFQDDTFLVKTSHQNFSADLVIGAFGKRSRLDHTLNRSFMNKRSPYAGVKYHIRTEHPDDLIALHNFSGGYCGISKVEGGITNLCYLTHRNLLRATGSIRSAEETFLFKNPLLRYIFSNSDFIWSKPEVINEISFASKTPVHKHILFAGDAAGMIAPLCGNGMAMAIHAAKIVSELVRLFAQNRIERNDLEARYSSIWNKRFSARLWKGRQIQKLFGNAIASNMAVNLMLFSRPLANAIVQNTHGKVF